MRIEDPLVEEMVNLRMGLDINCILVPSSLPGYANNLEQRTKRLAELRVKATREQLDEVNEIVTRTIYNVDKFGARVF